MKITKTMQKVAVDILNEFHFVHSKEDFFKAYDKVFERYDLYGDPFTKLPCTYDEYYKNKLAYERQVMLERSGHCDGLY